LINNRQGGRRRGRGGQRTPNMGGQSGNRQDNRQRGNAAQLLEKYKALARDSQLAGDRVQTEYYLQYAEHYFRVLGESRSRFEDQRPRRDDDADGDDEDEMMEAEGEVEEERPERPERRPRTEQRPERAERFNRPRRQSRDDDDRDESVQANGGGETIPFDVLPPAIGRDEAPAEEEQPRRPRRRTHAAPRPASDDDEVAPAA
jgi:hypothetical protein